MTPEQREALRNLSEWNQDDSNPRMFRVQDKGARPFIEWKKGIGTRLKIIWKIQEFLGKRIMIQVKRIK